MKHVHVLILMHITLNRLCGPVRVNKGYQIILIYYFVLHLQDKLSKRSFVREKLCHIPNYILLTKTTAAQNEAALSYHRLRGLYFLAVVFVRRIYVLCKHSISSTLPTG